MEASENGHTEMVAMLLQVEGIDVNEAVSSIIPTPITSTHHPTITNPCHY